MFKKICLLRKEERSGELYCTVYSPKNIPHSQREDMLCFPTTSIWMYNVYSYNPPV